MTTWYRFVLLDDNGSEFMGTDVDEPNPMIDMDFWNRFLVGDCFMAHTYTYEETDEHELLY